MKKIKPIYDKVIWNSDHTVVLGYEDIKDYELAGKINELVEAVNKLYEKKE